jgi:hypothetical protein
MKRSQIQDAAIVSGRLTEIERIYKIIEEGRRYKHVKTVGLDFVAVGHESEGGSISLDPGTALKILGQLQAEDEATLQLMGVEK